jgi:hypothetical protein
MLRLGIFFTNLLPIVGVAAVLTVPPIVAGIATDNPTAVELNPIVTPTNSANLHPVERVQRRLSEQLLTIITALRSRSAVGSTADRQST